MTTTIMLSALFGAGAVASYPLLKWGRLNEYALYKIERLCACVLFPSLLAIIVWLLFTLYQLSHAIILIEVIILAALMTMQRGVIEEGCFKIVFFFLIIPGLLIVISLFFFLIFLAMNERFFITFDELMSQYLPTILGIVVVCAAVLFCNNEIETNALRNTSHRVAVAIIIGILVSEMILRI